MSKTSSIKQNSSSYFFMLSFNNRAVSKSLKFNAMPHKNNNCRFNINYFFSLYVYFNAAIECDDGTYGYACVNNCSGHCINGSLCNKETGYCHNGCNAGYTNKDCSRGMIFHFSL